MAITASMVKELRERTGAGMMECKKVLTQTDGDMEAAIEELRIKGAAAAEKKAGRIAAEGVIVSAGSGDEGSLVEINCETDFVAKDDSFNAFSKQVAETVLSANPADNQALADASLASGVGVETARQELIAKIGENVSVRRFVKFDADGGCVSTYLHGNRIGVMVQLEGGDDQLGRDIAMHIAASNPLSVSEDEMDQDVLTREKDIFIAQAKESGKPDDIIEKMIGGRIKKFLKENTLLGQPFVKNPDQTVAQLLSDQGAKVKQMVRFEVGEGIEKREDDFVAEVMAQANA
ncbi:MAG: translation elongation factor Ts [Gammaproteobacteria bacterium]